MEEMIPARAEAVRNIKSAADNEDMEVYENIELFDLVKEKMSKRTRLVHKEDGTVELISRFIGNGGWKNRIWLFC